MSLKVRPLLTAMFTSPNAPSKIGAGVAYQDRPHLCAIAQGQ